MATRNHHSPALCLLLTISLAWPAPFGMVGPMGRGDVAAPAPRAWAPSAQDRSPRLVTSPVERPDEANLVAAACDLDDAEEADDHATSKRSPAALLHQSWDRSYSPFIIAAHPSSWSSPGSATAQPRLGPLRC